MAQNTGELFNEWRDSIYRMINYLLLFNTTAQDFNEANKYLK